MKSLPPNCPQEHFSPKNIKPQKNRQKEKNLDISRLFVCFLSSTLLDSSCFSS
nr:MAG TPA: hypothetical protein [Caudoviricetes sp.]